MKIPFYKTAAVMLVGSSLAESKSFSWEVNVNGKVETISLSADDADSVLDFIRTDLCSSYVGTDKDLCDANMLMRLHEQFLRTEVPGGTYEGR